MGGIKHVRSVSRHHDNIRRSGICIGKNRVYELLEKKELKGFRIGRVWKIPKEALKEYILSQSNLS